MSRVHAIAGVPGSGKTYHLRQILIDRIRGGLDPSRIWWSSYTKAGTRAGGNDLLTEVSGILLSRGIGVDPRHIERTIPCVRTIHSMAYNYGPIPKKELNLLSAGALGQLWQKAKEDPELKQKVVQHQGVLWESVKSRTRAGEFPDERARGSAIHAYDVRRARLLEVKNPPEKYLEAKEILGFLDFTDLLYLLLRRGWGQDAAVTPDGRLDVDVVAIDEAQDLTPLMLEIIRLWGPADADYYYAGDPDQCLYENLGVDHQSFAAIVKHAADHGRLTTLLESRRCSRAVCIYSTRAIQRIPVERRGQDKRMLPVELHPRFADSAIDDEWDYERFKKELPNTARRGPGGRGLVRADLVTASNDPISLSEIHRAYLAHTNAQLAGMITYCVYYGNMPLVIDESSGGARWFIKRELIEECYGVRFLGQKAQMKIPPMPDTLSDRFSAKRYLPTDDPGSLKRKGGRDDGYAELVWLQAWRLHWCGSDEARARDYLDAMYTLDHLTWLVSTIHGVKGMEFDGVVLRLEWSESDKADLINRGRPSDSGIRAWYVGASRAQNSLALHHVYDEDADLNTFDIPLINGLRRRRGAHEYCPVPLDGPTSMRLPPT